MIIPDINLLLYAYDQNSLFHSKAKTWWQDCLLGDEPIGLLQVVLFGFVRIGTNGRAFQNPMTAGEAAGHVRSWMEQPTVELLEPGSGHIERVLKLLEGIGTAGNLVTDAQIAAQALHHNATLHTTDMDFIRFPGLWWFNPLTGDRSPSRRRDKSV